MNRKLRNYDSLSNKPIKIPQKHRLKYIKKKDFLAQSKYLHYLCSDYEKSRNEKMRNMD